MNRTVINIQHLSICSTAGPGIPSGFLQLPPDMHFEAMTPGKPSLPDVPGTVVDQATGLMWSKATTAKGKTWAKAKEAAAAVRLGGFNDWRLPTRAELLTLVDDTRSNPAIDTERFECDPDWYWSSTPLASSPSVCAWSVDFNDGLAGYDLQHDVGRVRAVRSVSPAASGQ